MQLVINTFGASLRKQGEQFLIQAENQRLAVSAHKVQSIVLATAVHLTTDALQLALAHNVDVILLDGNGEPQGRFWQTRMGSTAAIRRRQLEAAQTEQGLALARGWAEAKLRHQAEFLEELCRRRPGQEELFAGALGGLRSGLERLADLTGTLDDRRGTLMGLEGSAGRGYFVCLGRLVPEGYRFEGRSRQPAKDAFNAMLNYAYGVLYGLVERACILAGLDPCLGFLHTDNYGKPSLVFDMIEPFRILGDRAVLLLFTGRRVQQGWFEEVPGGVALSKDGRAGLLSSFNERMERGVRYPVRSKPGRTRNIKQRDVIQFEAHALANLLLGRDDLPRIVQTRQLWEEGREEVPDEVDEEVGEPATLPEREEDEGMLTWVVYDITKDRTRTKVARRCLDFGLYRVQKSVFLGDVPSNRVEEIILFSQELLDPKTDAVYVFPMCRDDFDKVRIVGQGFDRQLVADEVLTKVI